MIEFAIAFIFSPVDMGFYIGHLGLRDNDEYDTDTFLCKLWIVLFQITLYRPKYTKQ